MNPKNERNSSTPDISTMHELFNPQLFIPEIFNTLVLKFMVKNFVVEIFGIERFLWALGWKIYGWSFHGWKVHTWIVHLLKIQVWNICGQKIHGWKFPFGFGVEMSFNLWFVVDAIPFQPKFPLHHFDSRNHQQYPTPSNQYKS